MISITRETLNNWAGADALRRGRSLVDSGRVRRFKMEPGRIEASIESSPRNIACSVAFPEQGGLPLNQCPCRDNREMGLFCHHAAALCLNLLAVREDPERLRRLKQERERAERLASAREEDYLTRVPPGTPGAIAVRLCIGVPEGIRGHWWQGEVPLRIEIEHRGRRAPIHDVRPDLQVVLPPREDNLLYVLEDIAAGPVPNELTAPAHDLENVLELMPGMRLWFGNREGFVSPEKLSCGLRLEMEEETGELLLDMEVRPPDGFEHALPAFWTAGRTAWVLLDTTLFRVEPLLPKALHNLYRERVRIPRGDVPRFLNRELPMLRKLVPLETEVNPDWFSLEPDEPSFRLEVRGSPASLSATLYAVYDGLEWVAGVEDSAGERVIPDPDNILRYRTRNPEREQQALDSLRRIGFGGERGDRMEGIVGASAVLSFCAAGIPALRRQGWKVDLAGRISEALEEADSLVPLVSIADSEQGWFDVQFTFETREGESLNLADVQQALLAGQSHITRRDTTYLFDRDAALQLLRTLEECGGDQKQGRPFRLDAVHGAYLKSTLDGLEGVDVEVPPAWLNAAERQNRPAKLEPVDPPPELQAELRPYQREGLSWLRFLERNHFGGILADEMGLGKTLQTLAWIQLKREHPEAKGLPALIICPTSLVENWIDEGQRFVPTLRFLNLTGSPARRDRVWEEEREQADVWVTSYAVVQRDLARYLKAPLGVLVLDEAQHIKNAKTNNAKAVKKLSARHRLVLTGTPVENSVMDLWSIMDFLMPGYLTTHALFKQRFEVPIRSGGQEAKEAQQRLRKKLQPFLLRRLKQDVAKDLPPKIEKVHYCRMTDDQRLVYQELVKRSRDRLESMVSSQGFERSRMEVLKTLLQLRQACCHLDLLKMPDLRSRAPSGKLELFREMMEEARDSGHRVLVFSQFTSMLSLLRDELESMDFSHCYLDGSTRNRMDVVRKFQGDPSIPVFLISLKAGGTGLNLTGADMVIHYDPWWNPAVENQATDRAYRIGQQKTVYSVKLITRESVEEKVLALQQRKQEVIDATLDPDSAMVKTLDWEDVQELLTL